MEFVSQKSSITAFCVALTPDIVTMYFGSDLGKKLHHVLSGSCATQKSSTPNHLYPSISVRPLTSYHPGVAYPRTSPVIPGVFLALNTSLTMCS